MNISDEAVAAAAKVIALGDMERTHYLVIAHAALVAAAPYLLANAWDEGYSAESAFAPPTNPYRTAK